MSQQHLINSLYDAGATDYEAQDGHSIAADEFDAWRRIYRRFLRMCQNNWRIKLLWIWVQARAYFHGF